MTSGENYRDDEWRRLLGMTPGVWDYTEPARVN